MTINLLLSSPIKYQAILSKITLIYVPLFIAIGLFTLFQGLHWLITNQIPYESLDVDLHQFVSFFIQNRSIILPLTLNLLKLKVKTPNL